MIGSRRSPLGGATEVGGLLQLHLTGTRRGALDLPCFTRSATPSLVEIHNVQITADLGSPPDGDRVLDVTDPTRLDLSEQMPAIHLEISGTWRSAGVAPVTALPPVGSRVDVQGFVY